MLTRRALNRATLDRQLLLARSTLPVVEAVEHLVGLQAQTPHSWYVGLGVRLEDVRPEQIAQLLLDRQLVRIALMRSTIHLVSVRDCLWLRPPTQPVLGRPAPGVARVRGPQQDGAGAGAAQGCVGAKRAHRVHDRRGVAGPVFGGRRVP